MKTLIVNGSPRKNGETASMINFAVSLLNGEYRLVNTYYADISPCTDCRSCREGYGCAIDDEMTELYEYIIKCNNVIFASPLYFSQYTGTFLSFMSRLQMLCTQKYISRQLVDIVPKKGLVLLNGGGSTVNTLGAEQTTRILMKEFNCKDYKIVCFKGSDRGHAMDDKRIISDIKAGVDILNNK